MKHSPYPANALNDSDPRTQFGAICWRKAKFGVDVLLITSRETGRWIVPKGWPISGGDGPRSAQREAWEEAGVEGKVGKNCLGLYSYQKVVDQDQSFLCVVAIYALQVEKLVRRYPEHSQRQRRWFSAAEAAEMVAEPELRMLLLGITDRVLGADDQPFGKKAKTAARSG